MRFKVDVPFGPFESGQVVTEQDVFAKVPDADLDRLVRRRSLVPLDGAASLLAPAPEPVSEAEAELVANLQKRVEDAEADRDLQKEAADRLTAERDALLQRVRELEAERAKAKEDDKAAKAAAAKAAKAAKADDAKAPAPAPEPAPPAPGR